MSSYSIYPKQFRNSRIPIEKNRCFMMMPFSTEYDLVYGEIKKVLTDSGFICNRADELFGSVPIMGRVLNEILRAHFVIADLTGQNANVFYELGIAHSFKDAHNIVLISQSIDDVPFDIRHLGAITYDVGNLKHLTSSTLKAITDNSHYFAFYETLQKTAIVDMIHDDMDEFLEYILRNMNDDIQIVTSIIDGQASNLNTEDVRRVLDQCLGLLYAAATGKSRRHLQGIMSVIGAILCNTEDFEYAHDVMKHLLFEIKLEQSTLSLSEIIHLQSELAVRLASHKAFFNDSITWIITYFTRSKSATVDLNRYSLERFLLTSTDREVDAAVVNSIFHENYYVREHMADIIGEKRIAAGLEALIAQLRREENIYATSSIITALGKLGEKSAYPALLDWFQRNRQKIVQTQHFFILKHFHIALLSMEVSDEFVSNFQKEFAEHLTPLAIY